MRHFNIGRRVGLWKKSATTLLPEQPNPARSTTIRIFPNPLLFLLIGLAGSAQIGLIQFRKPQVAGLPLFWRDKRLLVRFDAWGINAASRLSQKHYSRGKRTMLLKTYKTEDKKSLVLLWIELLSLNVLTLFQLRFSRFGQF
jgi:hypothetical protein